jgi:hypothetical protein
MEILRLKNAWPFLQSFQRPDERNNPNLNWQIMATSLCFEHTSRHYVV